MTQQDTIEQIRKVLSEEFEVDIDLIKPEAPLMETLELDSLDMVDIIVLIEKNFGFTATGQDFVGIKTFGDFYNFILSRQGGDA